MISVVIETENQAEPLARTLASLVGGAVEGLVREVVVIDRGSTDGTIAVAEHAGCVIAPGDFSSTLGAVKGEWLLLLEPGARLGEGWMDAARGHLGGPGGPARFTLSGQVWWRRFARPGLRGGLLIEKTRAQDAGLIGGVELARRVRTRRLVAEIVDTQSAV